MCVRMIDMLQSIMCDMNLVKNLEFIFTSTVLLYFMFSYLFLPPFLFKIRLFVYENRTTKTERSPPNIYTDFQSSLEKKTLSITLETYTLPTL
jgi:hypothetical protein